MEDLNLTSMEVTVLALLLVLKKGECFLKGSKLCLVSQCNGGPELDQNGVNISCLVLVLKQVECFLKDSKLCLVVEYETKERSSFRYLQTAMY